MGDPPFGGSTKFIVRVESVVDCGMRLSRVAAALGIVPRVDNIDMNPGGEGTPEVGVTATVADGGESPSALTAIKFMLYVVPGVSPKIHR